MKRACVIGWPIEHSRSPMIHGYWLRQLGIDGTYTKVAVPPEDAYDFLVSLARHGFVGCNVTVPHKETAYRAAALREPSADAVGAANTLWLEDGRLCAANTDTYGYITHLSQKAPDWQRPGRAVAVLGAGGAARAIAYGLLEAGVAQIRLFNRSRHRAEEMARYFGPRVVAHDWDERSRMSRDCAVLVNTTTVGLKNAGSLGIDFSGFADDCIVSDIVYVPIETGLLTEARAHGLRTVDGLGMLLHQAVPGFERWFGVRPTVTAELYDLVAADIRAATW